MNQTKEVNNKKKRQSRSHIPGRLNLLFFVIFILFVTLILRMAFLQIIQGQEFTEIVRRTESTVVEGSVPRGEIYDANHRKMVGNEPIQTISYMRGQDVSGTDMAQVAQELSKYIEMDVASQVESPEDYDLSIRDLQDYYVVIHEDAINDQLTDEEQLLQGSALYEAQLNKVPEEAIEEISAQDIEAAAIFKRMNSGYALSNQTLKKDGVTDQEIALVNENIDSLPGVSTGIDWVRNYPQGDLLRSVLGSVSSEEQGIPEEASNIYLARGYSRNDRVGQSYLEQEYESVLKGSKSSYITETNQNGEITNQVEQFEGSKGSNLVLNLDVGFQAVVEGIAENYLTEHSQGLNNQIYIVATDPRNGKVLSLVGKKENLETGEIEDDALGTFTQNFVAGSSIKGATILAASMDGVLDSSNNVMVDEPLYIAGTSPIRSLYNQSGRDMVDDISALEVSSNVYMSKLAMRMGGVQEFENGGALDLDPNATIDKMRGYFEQFGLGVETGIDLPGEQIGYKGTADNPGHALYYSFGQFDSYTPLQLAQYISTIANGGIRYAPSVVSEVRDTSQDGSLGVLQAQNEPKVLNTVQVDPEALDRVKQGMRDVLYGDRGTGSNFFQDTEFTAGGKTGTAETIYFGDDESMVGEDVLNRTFVGFAPYDNPEIAISVVVPYLPLSGANYEINNVARAVFEAYFQVGDYADLASEYADQHPSPMEDKMGPLPEDEDEDESEEDEEGEDGQDDPSDNPEADS